MKRMGNKFTASVVFAVLLLGNITSCSLIWAPAKNEETENITALAFKSKKVSVELGNSEYLTYTVTPGSLQNSVTAAWDYDSSIISINPDKYGVVITGLAPGQSYLKATINGITSTAIITVTGEIAEYEGEPYIYSNYTVIELTPDSTQTVTASLYGGTITDLEEFSWTLKDPTLAAISYSRGSCIITGTRTGSTQLVVSHPKSTYSYTMIVYVYTDELKEAYLTTDTNIVTINKSDTSSRALSVDLVNPYTASWQSGFSWQVITESGTDCVSVTGNGNSAILTPIENGISLVRVTHTSCEWPLDILVRVTSTVQNVYIIPSVTALEVTGSTNSYSVYAEISGYSGYVNPDAFVWTVPDDAGSLLDYEACGNCLSVTGKKNGAVKVKVSHELAEYSRTILVVLRLQAGNAIDSSMYITTSSNYVTTQVGADTTSIAVSLVGGEPGDENALVWTIDNGENNSICRIVTPTGSVHSRSAGSYTDGNLYITPLTVGTVTVTVSHPKILYETEIVIRVLSEYALLEEPVYITSESSIVRLLNGTTKCLTASLTGNTSAGDENGLIWTSGNSSVISLSPSSGNTTVLCANGSGNNQTYISVNHKKAAGEKRILVLSADTTEELESMKGIYSDTSYYRINEDGSAELNLNSFGLASSDISAIKWTVDKPSICTVQAASGNYLKSTITGISMGTAMISAALSGCEPCNFFVTVLPADESVEVTQPRYLTTTKNAVVIPTIGSKANLSVTGVNITAADMTIGTVWKAEDTSIAEVSYSGGEATVTAVSEGKTKLIVTNPRSKNSISIDIKIGALYEWEDDYVVYITTEKDVVTMVAGQTCTIGASLENSTQTNGFTFSVTGNTNVIEATGTWTGTCFIEAHTPGMSEITIRNTASLFEKQVLVVVANSAEELSGFKYLSTTQNVVTVGESFSTTVTVNIKNTDTTILSGYRWISSDTSKITVVSSGSTAVFYGISTGTAKVTVTNDVCEYPVEIIANCVDPVLAASNPYISCTNIVTLTVGDSFTTLAADLIGGTEADYTDFTWHIQDSAVASLYSSNETARVRALRQGVTQLTISHPKANGIDRTVLVICEPELSGNCYITTTESIIKMPPSGSAKTITATLVNGSASDAHAFKWWADSYDIIDMNYTGESAVITPLGSGTVTIHVSHPKAANQKDIILYISQYSEFAFETTSKSVTAGTQAFVNMQVPVTNVKTRVSYKVTKTDGSPAADILTASGTDSVCILDPHSAGSAIITASLVALNSGTTQATCQLLVSVSASGNQTTYIKYTGQTIINIEKGVTKTLSASLAGLHAGFGDEKSICWKSSDPSIIKLAPSSASGTAVNNEVQITALQAGKECTITVSHEKANSDIILYCIIPGENAASITLDKTLINLIQGENAASISATITNAENNDYNGLVWSVAQNETKPPIILSGSGKKISILPRNAGTAKITATVPSSGKAAFCTVNIEEPKSISLSVDTVSVYPGEVFTVTYTVSPEAEMGTVTWVTSDSAYTGVVSDDKKGTLTLMGKYTEGIATVTGTTSSKASASFTVNNGWGNTFSLDKSLIKSVPVNTNDGTFDVNYEVKPACAEIRVWGLSNMTLETGTYDSYSNGIYTIRSSRHTSVNSETGIASGTIHFNPTGESDSSIVVQAWNPVETVIAGGHTAAYEVASKQIAMKVYYNAYTFIPASVSSDGIYSGYDEATGAFILGDGETLQFSLNAAETQGTPQIDSVKFVANEKAKEAKGDDDDEAFQYQQVSASVSYTSSFTITHNLDYGPASGIYHSVVSGDQAVEQYNTAVRLVPLAGTVTVTYRLFGSSSAKTYSFPLYVQVRNCTKTYQ